MSHNRRQAQTHHPHGNIPSNQAPGTIYTYQMMPQHIPGMFTQGAMNRMPVPQPMYYYNQQPQMSEEQMKMQIKEHNYHIQQQRLRSLNASTSQKRVNPDDFIHSMFGKPSNVRNNALVSAPKPEVKQITTPIAPKTPEIVQIEELPVTNNQKNLEDMLLECSDLMRPGKAHSFPKLKENKRKSSTEINLEPKSAFPNWCLTDPNLPDLYKRVERTVTNESSIDTSLLYPILVSSGLNHDILGHIWSLVNQTTPGQLQQHELYAALTLIALAQNGYKFTTLDILQSLTRPLVPYLKEKQPETPKSDENQEEFTEFLGFAPTVQPAVGSPAVGTRLACYNVDASPPAKEKAENAENDDKYGIFRQLDQERRSSESPDDEFGDFVTGNEAKIDKTGPERPEVVAKDPKSGPERPEVVARDAKSGPERPEVVAMDAKSVDLLIQSSLDQFEMIGKSTADFEFGDFVGPGGGCSNQSAENRSVSSLDLGPVDSASLHSLELKTSLHDDDPYRFVNCNAQSDSERSVQEWERCLDSCYELVNGANLILNDISSEAVCEEVISSDEGINYLKNIFEIYLITCRLQHSIKVSGLTNSTLDKLLVDINAAWTGLAPIFSKTTLTPKPEDFDATKAEQTCGVCLLGIGHIRHLEFSGRQYHAGCANFWVNCVNSMLPALSLHL